MIKNKYPKSFFDSREMKELRREAQITYDKDDKFAFYFIRPISIYFSKFICDYTQISANQITIFMSILGLLAPIILYFINSYSLFVFISIVSYFFIYFLDMVDGEVARIRKKTSELGVMYDMSLWYSLAIFNIVYIYKLFQLNNLNGAIDILILALFAYIINLYKYNVYNKYRKVKSTSESTIYLWVIILMRQGSFVVLPLLLLFIPNIIFIYGIAIYLILFSIYNIYGILNISKQLV